MDYIAQPKDYWIATNAIYMTLNALGDPDRIQGSVATGASILCYIKGVKPASEGAQYSANGDGLEYDNGHNYRRWPLALAPTYFNTHTAKYVYAAIPKSSEVGLQAIIVFPSEQIDIYGKNSSDEQIGSTNYFYIFLQGIITDSGVNGQIDRTWQTQIAFGTLSTDQALEDMTLSTDWYSYSNVSQVVTFLKQIVMGDDAFFENLKATLISLSGKNLTQVAGELTPVNSETSVATPAYISDHFLSKKNDDTAEGKITFEQGLNAGNFVADSRGAGIWKDEQGGWHIEGDYLYARRKLVAKEVQIEDVHHVGGQMVLTAAAMTADFVVEKDGAYRCFFRRVDTDGKEVNNTWQIGDQAYVNTFNLTHQEDGTVGNHFLWRLVTGTSNEGLDSTTYYINGEEIDASEYHYIDLSKTICAELSDVPLAGDDIVQLGYQGTDGADRQNAIIIAGAGSASPYIRQFTGIDSFHFPEPDTQIKPGDNKFSGIVSMENGSVLPNGADVADTINNLIGGQEQLATDMDELTTGNENLLRNTGFTGDYESADVESETDVAPDTQIYSPQLKYWEYESVSISQTIESATGMSAVIECGYIQQMPTKTLEAGEEYCISFKANGGYIYVNVGGYFEAIELSNHSEQKIIKFTCTNATDPFKLSGSCQVMEIQLTKGNIPNSDWIPSPLDNDKAINKFQDLVYLTNAITNASTTILGGLILSQMIRVGNYRDGFMAQETGGMSGLYQSGNSPFLWGGGDMEKAFYTIGKYANNPSYQASDEEVAQMAKFVVTHGGRAILNDIILRGYIYAVGGYFKGNLEIGSQDKFLVDSAKGELRMNGYSMVQDLPNYPVDPTSDKIDLLKLFYQVNQDSLARIARLLLNSHDGSISLDAAYGLHGTDGSASPTTVKTNIQNGFEHNTPLATASLGNGELVLYDKARDIETRFDGTSIRWFHNGVQTMGGVIDVDANGFLKVLLD